MPKVKPCIHANLSYLAVAMALLSCTSPCRNSIINQTASPNGAWKAVVFQRDCGATTGFTTQVSILSASESLPETKGNAFTADTDHGKAASGPGGGPSVQVRWISDVEMEISHDSNARVFTRERVVKSIQVRYNTFNAKNP